MTQLFQLCVSFLPFLALFDILKEVYEEMLAEEGVVPWNKSKSLSNFNCAHVFPGC